MKKNALAKPFLKWAGGKRQLIPEINKYLPNDFSSYTYYEPFLGAGALLFDKQPRKAVVNDTNSQLILTYNAIKEDVDLLIKLLKQHEEKHSEEYYYQIREKDRDVEKFDLLNDIEKAARLIYLNKTCYNGLYRVNSQGLFNVPFGRYKKPLICDESVLRAVSLYLNNSKIKMLNVDFETAIKGIREKSFVYFDPPYHSPNSSNFTGYQASGFDENEQKRLSDLFARLTNKNIKCLLSNSDTKFIRELYNSKDYKIVTIKAKRSINSNNKGRGEVNEVLIKNW